MPNGSFHIWGIKQFSGCQEFDVQHVENSVETLGKIPEVLQACLRAAVLQPSSDQAESSVTAPPDQDGGDDREPASGACTVDVVAGTDKSIAGDIICRPGGSGLECCYGGVGREKMLQLELMPNGRSLVGSWEYQNGATGPAKFDLTESCDLTHGRWGYAPNQANSSWNVAGRK